MVKHKLSILLAIVFAGCLALSACSVGGKADTRVPPSAASKTNSLTGQATAIPAGLESYYQQKVSWAPCEESDLKDYQCARVKVPLD
ncbi:MAG: hypothetical protein E6180_07675, partial [Varibaculum cambriense]|nr:hypothetical protein [Varibaculum cambriense]